MPVTSHYIGKSAEYLVLGELLARGFNGSLISVDVGHDIFAVKKDTLFAFQVKARKVTSKGYVFNIKKKRLKKMIKKSFFVFVLLGKTGKRFVIMDYDELREYIRQFAIKLNEKYQVYPVVIREKGSGLFMKNTRKIRHEISRHEGKWPGS